MRLFVLEVGMNVSECSWKSAALGASLVVLSAGSAVAAPAIVLDYLNLRVGPGYNYAVIEIIPAGWMVEAGGCADGWCQINDNGIAGYVDANYLGAPPPATASGSPYSYDNRSYWTYSYGAYDSLRDEPTYTYYDRYYGAPYFGSVAGAYRAARDADTTLNRRRTDRVSPKAAATNTPSGSPKAAAGSAARRLNRTDQ
jgi:uncharacterized protein YraI